MFRGLTRGFAFLERFIIGIDNFGFIGAVKLFFICRFSDSKSEQSINFRKLGKRFYFRGRSDWGVMSHFYTNGYRILDDKSASKVKYIIDAGANIGDEAVRFRFFHPHAKILSIEAEKNNYVMLSKNMGNDPNAINLHQGLWSKSCNLKVVAGAYNEDFSVKEAQTGEPYDIAAVSIPDLMDRYSIPEIDILKLDIEGSEQEIFSADSSSSWIGRVKIFIFECPDNDTPGTTMIIYEKLLQAGLRFRTHIHGENFVLIRDDVDWKLGTDLYFQS